MNCWAIVFLPVGLRPPAWTEIGARPRPFKSRPQQLIHADELVALGGKVIEQFSKACVEFVRAARPAAHVQQQEETVQPMRVFALALDNAVEDRL